MTLLILGADGYLGWPTAMHFASAGHQVIAADNYLRRTIAAQTNSEPLMPNPNLEKRAELFEAETGSRIEVEIGDLAKYRFMAGLLEKYQPDAVIHYAEQPSAPYSMRGLDEAQLTLNNNLNVTFNLIQAVLNHASDCHIVKLGTMGEYGTPNIDIEEGWLEVEHKGRKDTFLFPRAAGSLYHTTKVMDTDLLWFYVRTFGLKVTDLMQGPVYGLSTSESDLNEKLLPNFHYDDIFGTLINRFLVQAVAGVPLTVYGKGEQIRGYLNLKDTLQCVELAVENPAQEGELKIYNQLTENFSVNEAAKIISDVGNQLGLNVKAESIPNPRKEAENHYYNPVHTGLVELGMEPHFMTSEVVEQMLKEILKYKDRIDRDKIMPRVKWNEESKEA
jgi:UDP-sulfoquinovose synthase